MADARIEHTLECSEDTFWKVFFDAEYNKHLFFDELRFSGWKVVSQEEKDGKIERIVECVPDLGDLPGPLKKIAGNNAGYRERAVFDRAQKRMKTVIEPSVIADKLTITGELYTRASGANRCQRIYDLSVNAKVFGVGGMIESRIVSDVKASYEKAAGFTNRWVKEKGL